MKTRYMAQIALGALLAIGSPAVMAEKTRVDDRQLDRNARTAQTPAEHEAVAREYVTRARALEQKAELIERELRDTRSGPANPMAYKWPAMAGGRARQERMAVQTRRAAQESYALAERHSKLAGRSLEQIATDVD